MQNNQDNIPRNLIFIIVLIISAVSAYFFNNSILYIANSLFNLELKPDFILALEASSLWGIASYWCMFALNIFILAFLLPALNCVLSLVRLKGRLSTLPRAKDKAVQVTKEKFLKSMMGFNFIYSSCIVPFTDFLYEEATNNLQRKANFTKMAKTKKSQPVSVYALIPAAEFFKIDELLKSRLSYWFIKPLPIILLGFGLLILILSVFTMLQIGADELFNDQALEVLSIGYFSFSTSIAVALFIMAIHRMLGGHIVHRSGEVVKMIDSLFHYKPDISGKNIDLNSIEVALTKTASSFKDITNSIGQKQEEAVNQLIVNCMDDYVKQIGASSVVQANLLQQAIDNMRDGENKTYEQISEKIENLITSLNEEVKNASSSALDKNNIFEELNKTAKDLKSVSKASDDMMQKFDDMAVGLAHLLKQVEKMAPMSTDQREKLSLELQELKNNNKTVGMGRNSNAKSKAKK